MLTALRILSHTTISDKLNVSSAGFKILRYFRSLPNTAHIVPLFCFVFLSFLAFSIAEKSDTNLFFFFCGQPIPLSPQMFLESVLYLWN